MIDAQRHCTVPLSEGKVAIVDIDDFDRLKAFRWYANCSFGTWSAVAKRHNKTVIMHRLITNAPVGVLVDHRNNDGLDNRKCNLRFASAMQNQRNKKMPVNNTSGYKGVVWREHAKMWKAVITTEGRQKCLGYYQDKEHAARAYDFYARLYHGDFAQLNFAVALSGQSGSPRKI